MKCSHSPWNQWTTQGKEMLYRVPQFCRAYRASKYLNTESINWQIRINVLACNRRLTAVVWSDAISALSRENKAINVNETQCANSNMCAFSFHTLVITAVCLSLGVFCHTAVEHTRPGHTFSIPCILIIFIHQKVEKHIKISSNENNLNYKQCRTYWHTLSTPTNKPYQQHLQENSQNVTCSFNAPVYVISCLKLSETLRILHTM